ncbi:hypothetical protein P691DRAFT_807138 [Macrolepiota fuliginosa MF-IS2]|uniref:Uncharacterized protein n=1 Tax=Macrolepiota fuliginosa MF-IS2 TaxID=1400762 RepID=A0A9P5X506_9AGAR|nr:hypothetical protein P691DRAFT_807138 [Macrolepiota fuliginosa MF-IS2]
MQSPPEGTPQSSARPFQVLPRARVPKRSATYPGGNFSKRTIRISLEEKPPKHTLPSVPPPSPTQLWTLSSPTWGSSPETSSILSIEAVDVYCLSGENDATAEEGYGQVSDMGSLSTIEASQETRLDDFMAPLGSSWALDQCSRLYDLPDGNYSYAHDVTHSAGSDQAQDYLTYPPAHGFSDIQTRSFCSEVLVMSTPRNEDLETCAGSADDLSTWVGMSSDSIVNE